MDSRKTVVLITGTNGGIGFATASVLASASSSYHVIVGSRSSEKGKKAVAELKSQSPKGTISLVQLDISDEISITNAVTTVEKSSAAEELRESFDINTIGPALMNQKFTPLLLNSQKAKIINISSAMGSLSVREDPTDSMYRLPGEAYRLSKAALNMLTVCDYVRLGKQSVNLWAYCPGYVVSNLSSKEERVANGAGDPKESAQGLLAIIEGKRDANVGKFIHKDRVYAW